MSRRGYCAPPAPVRVSVTSGPLDFSTDRAHLFAAPGTYWWSRATAPVTCGAAIDVPLLVAKRLPGIDDRIEAPGATISTLLDMFENDCTFPELSMAPTAMAELMQARNPIWPMPPKLPLEITGTMP